MKEIKLSIENNLQVFQNNLQSASASFADLCKLYRLPKNGKQYDYFRKLISKNGFTIDHWNWRRKLRKYEKAEKKCPVCYEKFTTRLNSPKETFTCSHKCSNIYFKDKRHTNESNKKISDGINRYLLTIGKNKKSIIEIECVICGIKKETYNKLQKCCSNKCASKYRNKNPEYSKKISRSIKRNVELGIHKGWGMHIKGQTPSYAEKFFMGVLKSRGIKYEYDKKEGKYHVDFSIENKIALEIDGKQHKNLDLIVRDKSKDTYLKENGWLIYRIPWKSINTEEGKKYIKNEIDKFLQFYQLRKKIEVL